MVKELQALPMLTSPCCKRVWQTTSGKTSMVWQYFLPWKVICVQAVHANVFETLHEYRETPRAKNSGVKNCSSCRHHLRCTLKMNQFLYTHMLQCQTDTLVLPSVGCFPSKQLCQVDVLQLAPLNNWIRDTAALINRRPCPASGL